MKKSREKLEIECVDKIFKNYRIESIAINNWEEIWYVEIAFGNVPKGYNYWGIYYMPNGRPRPWEKGEMEEKNGTYTQVGSYFQYETEKIAENWFYYQCVTR